MGSCVRNNRWDRTIIVREFRSDDYGVMDKKYTTFPITTVITLDAFWFYTFYRRASERVEALRRIGELKNCYRAEIWLYRVLLNQIGLHLYQLVLVYSHGNK